MFQNSIYCCIIILGIYAFFLCASLSQITLTNGLTVLGRQMFQMGYWGSTSMGSITIPSTLTSIGLVVVVFVVLIIVMIVIIKLLGDGAVLFCYFLTQIILTNGLTILGDNMFLMGFMGSSNLVSVTIPSTVTYIGILIITVVVVVVAVVV